MVSRASTAWNFLADENQEKYSITEPTKTRNRNIIPLMPNDSQLRSRSSFCFQHPV